MNQANEIYENIKRICGEKNIPLTEVSRKSEISLYTMYSWKHRENPGVYSLLPIAKALNVSIDELVGWEHDNDRNGSVIEKQLVKTKHYLFEAALEQAKNAQRSQEIAASEMDSGAIATACRKYSKDCAAMEALIGVIFDSGLGTEFSDWIDGLPSMRPEEAYRCKKAMELIWLQMHRERKSRGMEGKK